MINEALVSQTAKAIAITGFFLFQMAMLARSEYMNIHWEMAEARKHRKLTCGG